MMVGLVEGGSLIADRYAIGRQLGRGGMATVYQAHDVRLGRDVAIKVLPVALAHDPTFVARFRREARMMARLEHPNILRVFDYGQDAATGLYYLVLEFLDGGSLKQYLSDRVPVPGLAAVNLLRPVASALDFAHDNQPPVVHRDLKPANIMFGLGRTVVCDFGLARIIRDSGESGDASLNTLTFGQVLGTPAYMAPEQAEGRQNDTAADRWALGVVAFEMLTGRLPFMGATPQLTLIQLLTRPVPRPSEINPRIGAATEDVLLRMLDRDPSARFTSALAFVDALGASIEPPQPMTHIAVQPTTQRAVAPQPPVASQSLQADSSPTLLSPRAHVSSHRPRRTRLFVATLVVVIALASGAIWGASRISAGPVSGAASVATVVPTQRP